MLVPSFYLYHLLRELCDEYPGIENTPIRTCALQDNYLVLYFDSEEAIEEFGKKYYSCANSVATKGLALAGIILSLYEEPPAPRHNELARFQPAALFQDIKGNDTAVARAKEIAQGLSTKPLILLGPSGSGKTTLLHSIANHVLQTTDEKTVFYMDRSLIDKLSFVCMSGQETMFFEELASYSVILFNEIEIFEKYPTPARDLFLSILRQLKASKKPFVIAGDPDRMPQLHFELQRIFPENCFIQVPTLEN